MRVLASTVSTLPNKLLAALPQAEWDVLRHDLHRARMMRGQMLLTSERPGEHAYFVEDGLVSVLTSAGDAAHGPGHGVQVAMIGSEGMVGGLALPSRAAIPVQAMVQFPGFVLSIPAAVLNVRMGEMPGLQRACLDYLHTFMAQVMEASASNARDSVLRRCVRWLLMADERNGGTDLPVTHEGLALLLGVRRPGVTLAMAVLHGEGLIQTRRGSVRLLDRPGLHAFGLSRTISAAARAA